MRRRWVALAILVDCSKSERNGKIVSVFVSSRVRHTPIVLGRFPKFRSYFWIFQLSLFSSFFFFFFINCLVTGKARIFLSQKKWQSIDKDYILAINLTTLCRVIGKLLSRWRDQNWNGGGGCVRAYACDTIASREKTYEISKLGKHLPLQKSYKLPQLLAETTLKLPFSRWRFRLLCALARGFVFTSRLLYELDRDDNFSLERYKNKFVTKRYCAYIQAS